MACHVPHRTPIHITGHAHVAAAKLGLSSTALGAATSVVAFTILALERRSAKVLAEALGVTADCIARWRSLGRDIPPRLAPRLVELVARRRW